ncbi:protein arv1 homolog isoform X1 [Vigna radiata var. radiata]|uniref:Protein ARV n=2 Tax=Vigna radiata var. radiata TaxID=3916 RepID=A0A1S3TC60_VIGRR|nr:protein arv1 homolog isoform X1 [Vigna radiata var. radiata]XP_014491357.1 protein arv1 homolog isoform X1 [Vigna radiata var. radiata]
MDYKCIQCGCPVKTLYVQYSPGNIRLMKCENCRAVADEYIECEIMILVIDLILHKPKAYRHLLHNVINQKTMKFQGLLWKLAIVFLLFEAHRCLILESGKGKTGSSMSFSSLVSICLKVLADVLFGNFMFLLTFFFMIKIFFHVSITISRRIDLLLILMISSYFKIFLVAMMVWEFPSSVIFIIELFCLSSNAVALKVMTESTMSRCVWTCFFAYAIKFLVTQILELILLGQLMQGWSQISSSFLKSA